jgi:hypothetical protein
MNIISKSGDMLGKYDFFFEWFNEPTQTELDNLEADIDKTLAPLETKYTVTNK